MKMRLILFLFVTQSVFSQVLVLKYEDIPEMIIKNNAIVKTYEEKVNLNILKERELSSNALPQLKFNARYSRLSKIDPFIIHVPLGVNTFQIDVYEPVQNQYFTRISLDYPIFTGLRLSNSIKSQSYFTKASQDELKSIQYEIIYRAQELYLKLFLSHQTKKILEANKKYLTSQRRIFENFLLNGLMTENDLLKIDIALTKNSIAILELENVINTFNSHLCQLLDIDLHTSIIPSFEIDSILVNQKIDDFNYYSPDIKSIENMIRAQKYLKSASLGEFIPHIFLNAGLDYAKPNLKFFPIKNVWKPTWDVNVILQFTIWDWLSPKTKADQINSQINQTELQLKNLKLKKKIDYENLVKRIEIEKEKIFLSMKEVDHARENLRQTENRLNVGIATTTDLLEANKALLEAETKLIEIKTNLILHYAELKKLVGNF